MPRGHMEPNQGEKQVAGDVLQPSSVQASRHRTSRRDTGGRVAILLFALAMGALFVVAGGVVWR